MYEHAKPLGISLVTISLRCVGFLFLSMRLAVRTNATVCRPSLMKYHTHFLTLVGDGTAGWTFTPIASSSARGTAADSAAGRIHGADDPGWWTCRRPHVGGNPDVREAIEEAQVWEAAVKELEEALQDRNGAELSDMR